MKTSLVVMAAGIGSRYGGGIKQIAKVGPSGEILMQYAIHDAINAGFDKVVFVIRKDLEEEFREVIGNEYEKNLEVAYAFQEVDELPEGFKVPDGRTKPWGTVQALLCARKVINEPFAVINADDYYGKGAYKMLQEYLTCTEPFENGKINIGMVSFVLRNTLSDNGGVTRGICCINDDNILTGINETKNIIPSPEGAVTMTDDGLVPVDPDSLVSMNMWGFFPNMLDKLAEKFHEFLKNGGCDSLTGEYVLPTAIDEMIKDNEVNIHIDKSEDRWFGVTYKEDREKVSEAISELVNSGEYESPLK